MKLAKKLLFLAAGSTAVYEVLVSSPWWTMMRQDRYDMLINLTVPSAVLLIFAYYLLQKKQYNFLAPLSLFIVVLQLSILLTIYGTIRGVLP